MIRVLLLTFAAFAIGAAPASKPEVLISKGTEISVVSKSTINSATASASDEIQFALGASVSAGSATIPKGSLIYGRVIEVQKSSAESKGSKVVVMFDFLLVGEKFHPLAAVITTGATPAGVTVEASRDYVAASQFASNTGNFKINKGTALKAKVIQDVTSE
ncbi:MAG: hypothetical protein HKN33_05735 [Pyrinomonadaceae bacterium]|nr:hypothetical protein [Pyrinomonadaceae bacterium]